MRALLQRVHSAHVRVDDKIVGSIEGGLLVLLGVTHGDTEDDVEWTARKTLELRIFTDDEGKMNRSLLDVHGSILLVSQFTLYADVRKGRRPGYDDAAPPERAKELYETFRRRCETYVPVETGIFQAHMDVALVNDGPVTILIDSKNRSRKR